MRIHTEGFADKHTYETKNHIWCITIEQAGCLCYAWIVLKKESEQTERLKAGFSEWSMRELPAVLAGDTNKIQKEVNRFGRWLTDSSTGGADETAPLLCVYYKARLFVYGEEKNAFFAYQRPAGIYLSPGLFRFLLSERTGGAADITDRAKLRRLLKEEKSLEEHTHFLNQMLLKGLSAGAFDSAYFFLWEDWSNV